MVGPGGVEEEWACDSDAGAEVAVIEDQLDDEAAPDDLPAAAPADAPPALEEAEGDGPEEAPVDFASCVSSGQAKEYDKKCKPYLTLKAFSIKGCRRA